jgi:hypothetical protein
MDFVKWAQRIYKHRLVLNFLTVEFCGLSHHEEVKIIISEKHGASFFEDEMTEKQSQRVYVEL